MSYWNTVNSAIGYWPLQESSGTIASDITGNGHDGVLSNLSFNLNSKSGPTSWLSSALEADGSSLQRVVVPDHADLRGGGQVSLSAWIDISIDETLVPIGKGSGVAEKDYSIIKYDSTHASYPDQSGYYSETGGTDYRVLATHPLGQQWLHVVVTYDNSTGTTSTYFDGVLVATGATAAESADTNSSVVFFTLPYETSGRAGAIAGLGMWNRVLTSEEVSDLFLGPIPTSLTLPVISGDLAVSSEVGLVSAGWEHHGYEVISESSYIEVSANGLDNWSVLPDSEAVTTYTFPTSLADSYIRLASIAENEIGISETAYSEIYLVSTFPWLAHFEQGEISIVGISQAEINLEAGAVAGLILAGGKK